MYVKKEKESHSDEINSNNHHKGMVATDKPYEHTKHSQHHRQQQQHHQEPISSQYSVNLHFDTIVPEARRNTALTISVAEKSGTPVREFEFVHDKLMHLIIVGEDLSYFAHIHPTLAGNEGNFTIHHIFPESGLPTQSLRILVYDGVYIKESSDRNYRISLKLPQERIVAKRDTDIVFSISDALGNPITDLEPLMGAGGHSVIISSDIQEFLHVHPTDEVEQNWKGGPHISFRTSFPQLGLYKAWGQFQHKGKIIMADFVLEVT